MHRFELHVPETFNDGSPVPKELLTSYEDALGEIALESMLNTGTGEAGVSVIPHTSGLWWSIDGSKFREPTRIYLLDVEDRAGSENRIRVLGLQIAAGLSQEAVYCTVSPIDTLVIREALTV